MHENHPKHCMKLNSIIGKFKDESEGNEYEEWIFLRPKCYSLLTRHKPKLKAKGVNLKNTGISHSSYVDCYQTGQSVTINQTKFITRQHQLYTHKFPKVALTVNDDKRCWVNKNQSLAFGHWALWDEYEM